MLLRLEGSWHVGLGCEATWQAGFLLAGHVLRLCAGLASQQLWMELGHGTALLPDVESHILTQFLSRYQIRQLLHLLWLSAAGETAVLCHTCRHAGAVRGTTGRASLRASKVCKSWHCFVLYEEQVPDTAASPPPWV